LKSDGTVVAAGSKRWDYGKDWRDIIAVCTNNGRIVGLKKSGTVLVDGFIGDNQDDNQDLRDIVAIAANANYNICLKVDGTVVESNTGTLDWRDIVAVTGTCFNAVGLKADGTVVTNYNDKKNAVQNWRNIVAISAALDRIVGLRADGTVIAIGNDKNDKGQNNTQNWSNIGPMPEDKLLKIRGLCKYCGGKLEGLFTKKCKSCGKKN